MSDLKYLKSRAAESYKSLMTVLETLNRDHKKPDTHWEMDEDKGVVRRVKLPSLEWEPFEEPNEQYTQEEQEMVLRK